VTPAQIAKGALRRLALAKLEPTPENYAKAWAEEGGEADPAGLPERVRPLVDKLAARASDEAAVRDELAGALMRGQWDLLSRALDRDAEGGASRAEAWAQLIERIARGLERGGRQWTSARKKESLHRVLDGSRSDVQRLQQRLRQLVAGWENDATDDKVDTGFHDDLPAAAPAPPQAALDEAGWAAVVQSFEGAMRSALPRDEARAAELADELGRLADRIGAEGATAELVAAVASLCARARRLFAHRHHLLEQLGGLCRELTAGLVELAEEESWAHGQAQAMQARLADGVSARGVRSASELLAQTRERQAALRGERERAKDALKGLIQSLLAQVGELGEHTGRFGEAMGRYADVVERADSIDQLAGVVREMVEQSRDVRERVQRTHERLTSEHARAGELEARVRELEGELRRLSDEVSTDALTQVANRRGLMQAFEVERARLERQGGDLAVALLDIDNFKKLNDSLGHAAGDTALKALAERVRTSLRPVDLVARYGGEEFVVLLPGSPPDEAREALTRLQRALSASLFMHDEREVFVTFSAGVTAYRAGEAIEAALERADEAMYEAKRTGKNRTCVA
jgi:diguanylate cyclase